MSSIDESSEDVIHLYHFDALMAYNSVLHKNPRMDRTSLSKEIGDSISTYIETCQRYKSEVAATNVRQLIDSFNSAGVSEATDDIHQRPIISPIEAYQIVSLGLFTIEKAFLVKSLHEKFLNHQDALQSLLDGLASLAQ